MAATLSQRGESTLQPTPTLAEIQFLEQRLETLRGSLSSNQVNLANTEASIPVSLMPGANQEAVPIPNMLFYDEYDNDINRRANKVYASQNHIVFNGAGTIADFTELERVRRFQLNCAHKKALLDQIEAKKQAKQVEKSRKRMEEARVLAEQEEMLLKFRQRNPEVQKQPQSETLASSGQKISFTEKICSQDRPKTPASILKRSRRIENSPPSKPDPKPSNSPKTSQAQLDLGHFNAQNIFADKDYIRDIIDDVQKKISEDIKGRISRFQDHFEANSEALRTEILHLRQTALETAKQKDRIEEDVHRLRKGIAQLRYEDAIRTNQLVAALNEEQNHKILASDTFYRNYDKPSYFETQSYAQQEADVLDSITAWSNSGYSGGIFLESGRQKGKCEYPKRDYEAEDRLNFYSVCEKASRPSYYYSA